MNWTDVISKAVTLYDTVSGWVYSNPVETDLIIAATVAGSLLLYTNRARRLRRKAHLILWGSLMKPQHREKLQKMRIEDAIVDVCMEMVQTGEMTSDQEAKWYVKMSRAYGLVGLMPGRNQASVKRGINIRLLRGWWTKKPKLPGDAPGGPVDPNYKPKFEVARRGLKSSKYITET